MRRTDENDLEAFVKELANAQCESIIFTITIDIRGDGGKWYVFSRKYKQAFQLSTMMIQNLGTPKVLWAGINRSFSYMRAIIRKTVQKIWEAPKNRSE